MRHGPGPGHPRRRVGGDRRRLPAVDEVLRRPTACTARWWSGSTNSRTRSFTPEKLHENSARREYLEASFDVIRDEYGPFEEYLAGPCGMDPARRERLKDRLLE
ncbi:hypothetical protein ACN94_02790 [Gordonia paraffinivorans]|nr:hypothetical protein [Gordonia paraffinivorans]PWD41654.1 hypothetical protein ACN93_18415 [Gordonia paraffinivorans]